MIVTEVETLRLEESPNILWVLVHINEGLTGLGEAKKIATMAEAYHLPVAPHDCTGPVVLAASTHLCVNLPNALTQETV
ncbi:MAG TPA: enolase C-terminal domain-like protein, partial [Rubrobacteraceae bacterium]|nr:enolase C-terminal domain-like protein [Rubrobacteraceae bacterium]